MTQKYTVCIDCEQPFASDNCFTKEGWAETQISGQCEKCFDALFEEDLTQAAIW